MAMSAETGIESATTSVKRTRHRNRNRIRTANSPPSQAVSFNEPSDVSMNSPWLNSTRNWNSPRSCGSASSAAMVAFRRRAVSTVLACPSFATSP
jgi:hypothetical protein